MIYPIVVMPALNEADLLPASCRSLGFEAGRSDDCASLVLVDNGSTDGTREFAARLAAGMPSDRFVSVFENSRGYVPARHAGVLAAARHAAGLGIPPERTLLLQADADTHYGPGYVEAMRDAADRYGAGLLFEGASIPPPDDPCAAFRGLEAASDADFDACDDGSDVVVDDKVVGYLLSDYAAWGGHRREYGVRPPHDEIMAETSRLLIRAKMRFGARRIRVDDAEATTSSRRILEDPALAFATAGFPREAAWREVWDASYSGPRSLRSFAFEEPAHLLSEAIVTRRRHLEAMFRHLPDLVERTIASRSSAARRIRDGGGKAEIAPENDAEAGTLIQEAFERAGVP